MYCDIISSLNSVCIYQTISIYSAFIVTKICAVYREVTLNDHRFQKWFMKFHSGDFLLNNTPWFEIDSD